MQSGMTQTNGSPEFPAPPPPRRLTAACPHLYLLLLSAHLPPPVSFVFPPPPCHNGTVLHTCNSGPSPSYLFGATTWREGRLTPARCRKYHDAFSPNGARRAPLAHLTNWPICKVIATYKWRKNQSSLTPLIRNGGWPDFCLPDRQGQCRYLGVCLTGLQVEQLA